MWPPAQAAPAPDDAPAPAAQPSLQPSAMVDPLSSPRLEHAPPDDHSRSDRVLSQEEAWEQRHGGAVPPGAPGVLKLPSLSASMPAPSQTLPPPPAAAPSADKPKRRVRTQTPDSGASQTAPPPAPSSAQSHDSKEVRTSLHCTLLTMRSVCRVCRGAKAARGDRAQVGAGVGEESAEGRESHQEEKVCLSVCCVLVL